MKFKKIIKVLLAVSTISLVTIPVISCASCYSNINNINDEYGTNILLPTNNDPKKLKELTFKDYFSKKPLKSFERIKEELKVEITNTINKYRLSEWNDYYQNSQNNLEKNEVFDINYTDFKTSNVVKKVNNFFKNEKIISTDIFNKQDEQFRYFNNFINIMNNGDENLTSNEKKDHNYEDFLYQRSIFYEACAADKYWNIKVEILGVKKPIKDIGITDWTEAITEAVVSAGSNKTSLNNIFDGFWKYYRIFSKEPNILNWELANLDLAMRLSSIPQKEIDNWPLWEQKIKRFKKMQKLQQKMKNLLLDSILEIPGVKPPINLPPNQNEQQNQEMINKINGYLSSLKNFLEKLFNEILKIIEVDVKLKKNDYYNENQ